MLVTTLNNDYTFTAYTYEPEHKAEVIGFYTKAYWNQEIQGYKILLEDGSVINLGSN